MFGQVIQMPAIQGKTGQDLLALRDENTQEELVLDISESEELVLDTSESEELVLDISES